MNPARHAVWLGALTVCSAVYACKPKSQTLVAAQASARASSVVVSPSAAPLESAVASASASPLVNAAADAGAAPLPPAPSVAIEVPYRGMLGAEKVVFRLTKTHSIVEGRYFTERAGVDVLVAGRGQRDGSFTLKEKDSTAIWTGIWKGDQLRGTRQLGEEEQELVATRVKQASGPTWAPIFVVTKRIVAPCTARGPNSAKFEYPELVGGFAPEREAEINQALTPDPERIECEQDSHRVLETRVLFNAQGIVSLEQRAATLHDRPDDSAGIGASWSQEYSSYSLGMQRQLKTEDLFPDLIGKPAEALFRAQIAETRKTDAVLDALEKKRPVSLELYCDCFAVEGAGIRVIPRSSDAPWGGVLLPYTELEAKHLLTPESPIAELAARALKAAK